MGPGKGMYIGDMDRWTMCVLWLYCYIGYMLGRAPRTKETLPDFCENIGLDKWDTIVWYRVTRNQ